MALRELEAALAGEGDVITLTTHLNPEILGQSSVIPPYLQAREPGDDACGRNTDNRS